MSEPVFFPKFPLDALPFQPGDSVVVPCYVFVYSNRKGVVRKKSLRSQTIVIDYLLPGNNSTGPFLAWHGGQNYLNWVDVNDVYDPKLHSLTRRTITYIKRLGNSIDPVSDFKFVYYFAPTEYTIPALATLQIDTGIDMYIPPAESLSVTIHPRLQNTLLSNTVFLGSGTSPIHLFVFNPSSRTVVLPATSPVAIATLFLPEPLTLCEVEAFVT